MAEVCQEKRRAPRGTLFKSRIRPLHPHLGLEIAVQHLDGAFDLLFHLLVREAEVEGHRRVENQVGVVLPGDHLEVVDGDAPVDAADQGLHPLPGLLGDAVVHGHRVHVNHRLAAQALPEFPLHVVDAPVELQELAPGGDLGVERDHPPAGAVVVDDDIVDAQDGLVGENQGLDLLHELRRGRRAQ